MGDDPIHRRGRMGGVEFSLLSGGGEVGFTSGLLAEAKFCLAALQAVEEDGELAGDSDTCPSYAPGPFAAVQQQRVCSLVERSAGEFVAESADLALDMGFARLVACPDRAAVAAGEARWPAPNDRSVRVAERDPLSDRDQLPLAHAATGVSAEEHGLWLLPALWVGGHLA